MKTYIVVFVVVSILIPMVHFLRPIFSRLLPSVAIFFIAVIISNAFFNAFSSSVAVERASPIDKVVRGIDEKYIEAGDGKKMLIVGSSYVSRGINGEGLEEYLNKAVGVGSFDVFQLSYPGINAYEQDYFLDYLFSKGLQFDIVVIELGSEGVLGVDQENIFKSNVIRYHDWDRFILLLKTALFDGNVESVLKRSEYVISHVKHFMAKLFNLGFVNQLQPVNEVEIESGYQPEVYNGFVMSQLGVQNHKLSKTVESYPVTSQFRRSQAEKLKNFSVSQIMFLQPPFGFSEKRKFTSELCQYTKEICILSENAMGLLGGNEYWTDDNHLSDAGAEIYTQWLSEELKKRIKNDYAF